MEKHLVKNITYKEEFIKFSHNAIILTETNSYYKTLKRTFHLYDNSENNDFCFNKNKQTANSSKIIKSKKIIKSNF